MQDNVNQFHEPNKKLSLAPKRKQKLNLNQPSSLNDHHHNEMVEKVNVVDAQPMHYVSEKDWEEFNAYKSKNNQVQRTGVLDVNPYKVLVDTVKNPFDLNVLEQQFGVQELDQRKILAEEIEKDKIPTFFRTERITYWAKISIYLAIALVSLFIIFWLLWAMDTKQHFYHPGYFAPPTIALIIALVLFVVDLIRVVFLQKEIVKMKNKFDPMFVSASIQGIYKRLIASFSNINWFSLYVYLLSGFFLLIMFIVFYFMSVNNFLDQASSNNTQHLHLLKPYFGSLYYGQPDNPNYITPKVLVIVVGCICLFTLLNQIVLQIINLIRIKRMEFAYKVPIITEEAKQAIISATNKRNFIIFLVLTIVLGLIVFLTYRFMKKAK